MDDDGERLRRRTAAYRRPMSPGTDTLQIARFLKRVQDDTAAMEVTTDVPQDLGPAYLRNRAAHFRGIAKQQADPRRAKRFNDVAALFEKHARLKEHSPVPHET